ncbi:MAG: endonuclease [Paludibacteraceae bacterium]|nr:endonuclease [Paludibacteraceae bacterium]
MSRFKHFSLYSFSVAVFILYSAFAQANVIVGQAAIPAGYYNNVDNKTNADNILNALCQIIDNHTVIAYSGLEPYYAQTDFYNDTLWDMYSTCTFYMSHANVAQQAVCDGWNKEHLVCQSWLGSGPMVSDLFNVYPTDARINNLRSNYPYGVVSGTFSGFSKDPQHHGLGKLGTSTTANIGTVYEPDDQYKGDFARSFFYMVARYRENTLNSGNGSKMFTSSPTNLTTYSLSFLLDWHRQDPVSQKEIDRNQAVYGIQHNRNPFIDYPELVEYIWGNRVGQTVDLSTMTPTCEGGGYDPTVTFKYAISWSVCGTVNQVDSIIAGRAITDLPVAPVSCSLESDVFMGWTTAPIDGQSDQRPAVLYTKPADFPIASADVTYYAVFAKATQSATVTPAVYTFDADHQDGWENTASLMNQSYWLLDQGKTLTSPDVDLAGLSSIEVTIRTYGGTGYCNLDVTANGQPVTTIVATNGKVLTDYTWTNTSGFSGRAPLVFSTAYGANQGIGFTRITINATGAGITYSRYITTCQSTGEIEPILDNIRGKKLLIGGQLYILIGDQLYTVTGQKTNF